MANVAVLPGFLGTVIRDEGATALGQGELWPSPFNIMRGGLKALQLAPNGRDPGPLAGDVTPAPAAPLDAYYGALIKAIKDAGHAVLGVGYDWRKSVQDGYPTAWARIAAEFGDGPVTLVAHSMGGLVAKAVIQRFITQHLPNYIDRCIFLGTPHWGSFEPYRTFFGNSDLMKRLYEVQGWGFDASRTAAPDYLNAVIASFPSMYELLPFRDSGPLKTTNPDVATALYQKARYTEVNSWVTQARLDAAPPAQQLTAGLPAGPKYYQINGVDFPTPRMCEDLAKGAADASYDYTNDGDKFVTNAEAGVVGLDGTTFSIEHNKLAMAPVCIRWVVQLLKVL